MPTRSDERCTDRWSNWCRASDVWLRTESPFRPQLFTHNRMPAGVKVISFLEAVKLARHFIDGTSQPDHPVPKRLRIHQVADSARQKTDSESCRLDAI